MEPISVPLRSRRRERGLIVQKIQHVIPAVALFIVGMQALKEPAHGGELALAILQLVTSAGLVVNFLREVRAARRPHAAAHEHHGADWFEIFAAGVLYAEALETWHLKHRIPNATLTMATVTLLLGVQHGRLAARRARHRVLRVDDRGVRVGGRFWRTFDAGWKDIAAIDVTTAKAAIRTRQGRTRRLNLDDLHDGEEVRRALTAASAHLARRPPSL